MGESKGDGGRRKRAGDERRARAAEALRDNLRKRKAQARLKAEARDAAPDRQEKPDGSRT